jgi:hypothetical protein
MYYLKYFSYLIVLGLFSPLDTLASFMRRTYELILSSSPLTELVPR